MRRPSYQTFTKFRKVIGLCAITTRKSDTWIIVGRLFLINWLVCVCVCVCEIVGIVTYGDYIKFRLCLFVLLLLLKWGERLVQLIVYIVFQ